MPSGDRSRERKSGPNAGNSLLLPILGAIGAIALVFVVKFAFQEKALEKSTELKEKKIAEKRVEQPVEEPPAEVVAIPDDPLDFLPPPPPLPGPDGLDDLKFDIGDGSAETETKASERKNATSGDWKLSN